MELNPLVEMSSHDSNPCPSSGSLDQHHQGSCENATSTNEALALTIVSAMDWCSRVALKLLKSLLFEGKWRRRGTPDTAIKLKEVSADQQDLVKQICHKLRGLGPFF